MCVVVVMLGSFSDSIRGFLNLGAGMTSTSQAKAKTLFVFRAKGGQLTEEFVDGDWPAEGQGAGDLHCLVDGIVPGGRDLRRVSP